MNRLIAVAIVGLAGALAQAHADIVVQMRLLTAEGQGETIGAVTIAENAHGALITPELSGLPPGVHGFHVHQNADCGPADKNGTSVPGLAAGGHFDPTGAGRHEGPYGNGHLGDLPPLFVDGSGDARYPLLAPRVTPELVKGRALIVHAGADNFLDQPKKLGGGGARLACGVIE